METSNLCVNSCSEYSDDHEDSSNRYMITLLNKETDGQWHAELTFAYRSVLPHNHADSYRSLPNSNTY